MMLVMRVMHREKIYYSLNDENETVSVFSTMRKMFLTLKITVMVLMMKINEIMEMKRMMMTQMMMMGVLASGLLCTTSLGRNYTLPGSEG